MNMVLRVFVLDLIYNQNKQTKKYNLLQNKQLLRLNSENGVLEGLGYYL